MAEKYCEKDMAAVAPTLLAEVTLSDGNCVNRSSFDLGKDEWLSELDLNPAKTIVWLSLSRHNRTPLQDTTTASLNKSTLLNCKRLLQEFQ